MLNYAKKYIARRIVVYGYRFSFQHQKSWSQRLISICRNGRSVIGAVGLNIISFAIGSNISIMIFVVLFWLVVVESLVPL